MTILKRNTAKGRALVDRAERFNEGYYLSQVYGHCSYEKQKAWNHCIELCRKDNGYGFHIISHNCHRFSVAWYRENGDIRIETGVNSYLITF